MNLVKKYPNGIRSYNNLGSGEELRKFLLERIAKRNVKSKNTIQIGRAHV